MPIAAVVARSDITEQADAYVSSTYSGQPAACAAAIKTIEILYRDRLFDYANALGAYALEWLCAMKEKYAIIGDVRGKGLWLAVEFVTDRTTRGKNFAAARESERAITSERSLTTSTTASPGSSASSRRSISTAISSSRGWTSSKRRSPL